VEPFSDHDWRIASEREAKIRLHHGNVDEDLICLSFSLTISQGSMTSQQRTLAIKEFHANKAIHVMILGLKAGGLGLNLTCANRGILVYVSFLCSKYFSLTIGRDPWWNKAV
jgi:hypothetical protein